MLCKEECSCEGLVSLMRKLQLIEMGYMSKISDAPLIVEYIIVACLALNLENLLARLAFECDN